MFIKNKFDQEVFFENGTKRFVRNVIRIESGNWFHLLTEEGIEYIFPPEKILFVRVMPSGKEERKKINKVTRHKEEI